MKKIKILLLSLTLVLHWRRAMNKVKTWLALDGLLKDKTVWITRQLRNNY